MKRIFTKCASFAALAFMAFGLAGCVEQEPEDNQEPEGETTAYVFEASLKSVDQVSAVIEINAENIAEACYVLSNESGVYDDKAVIFKNGTAIDLKSPTLKIEGLDANKTYWAYFAARIDASSFFEDIIVVEIKTADYQFSDLVTVVETDYQGYAVRLTMPESVRKNPEKYGIRFNFGSLCDVIDAKYGMNETWAANLLNNGHGCKGWQETQRDTTVTINPYNENRLNPDGTEYLDPSSGEPVMLHTPIAPGEPYVFVAGEYEYGDISETGWGWSYGEGKDVGYFIPRWDQAGYEAAKGKTPNKEDLVLDVVNGLFLSGEEEYWEGALHAKFFMTKAPEPLDAELEMYIDNKEFIDGNESYTKTNSPVDAVLKIIPDENVSFYSYFVCNDALYNQLLEGYLLGHEEWLQWFVCSYYAMRTLSVPTVAGPLNNMAVSEIMGGYLDAENVYHVLVTATADVDGVLKQKFFHKKFETPAKVLDPPVIKVTAVEDGQNEYFAKFNIKAPNKDLISASYGANYKSDFILDHNDGTSYENFAQNPFTEDEVKQINSDKGLEIWINSTDGQTTRCVVVGLNAERTRNNVFSPEKVGPCDAVADCRTKMLAMVPKIDSPLFNELEGTWTATAKMLVRSYDSNNVLQIYTTTAKNKVEIMNSIDLPELTQDVYDLYATFGIDKEEVEMLYDDLQREVDHFNNYRLVYRNRLLCLGWFDYDNFNPSRLSTKSPYDLFTWDEYSSVDNAQAMYDFGPKWYMEIDKSGNVTVPFDMWETPPMTNWQRTPFFMSAYAYYGADGKEINHGYKTEVIKESTGEAFMPGAFPVEVSSDRKKIVIKPVMAAIDTTASNLASAKLHAHYPNAIGGWGAHDAQLIRPVVSEITLTYGWTETSQSAVMAANGNFVESVDLTGEDMVPVVFKSMTPLPEKIEMEPFRYVRPIFYTTDEAYYRDFPEHAGR